MARSHNGALAAHAPSNGVFMGVLGDLCRKTCLSSYLFDSKLLMSGIKKSPLGAIFFRLLEGAYQFKGVFLLLR